MKKLTLWERSSLQFAILDRLHDVFFDVKDEIDVTPEFIQNTLEQYMQIATGDNYYLSRSVRLGEGELQQCSSCAGWDDYLSSLCGDDEGEENLSNQNNQQPAGEIKSSFNASDLNLSVRNGSLYSEKFGEQEIKRIEIITLTDATGRDNRQIDTIVTWFDSNQKAQQSVDKPVEQNIPSNSEPVNKVIEGKKYGLTYQAKPLTSSEKMELMHGIVRVINNYRDKNCLILSEDLQSVFDAICALGMKRVEITGISKDTGKSI
ncbi:hypothetical protein [Xenorhabdus szentirmaii]|uniref:Uncharacterized protein n=1 Tax=Xenorhabdus szentirmaii DSM 16338 TaxID=1427518 RepID=W1IZF0_9GAMM|nr:hypothetical protein [Xenorhabdus szentirmaii]PHM32060.1 hypothetical protein Xsze_02789 [Xenorhabdus szentirmaii DSM 16338]CDL83862.1 hypothetical protein XSR1_380026 [Xenorhabdus szentirmaii DSM 16338]